MGSRQWSGGCLLAAVLAAGWNGVQTREPPRGVVRADGAAFADDRGTWLPVGATLFWAPWGYKFDRARLERDLALLSRGGVDYIRVLGQVGVPGDPDDSWSDRLIDPGWSNACAGTAATDCGTYDEVTAGLTDLAFDKYGLRVMWTVFGGTGFTPTPESRRALVDRLLAMSRGREHKIMHFEIANEFYQNGFPGRQGEAELRALGRHMQQQTPVLVALSAPRGSDCASAQRLYAGGVGELVTEHFSRSARGPAGLWEPIRNVWDLQFCRGLPALRSSNEPIGPFSSVRAEDDPRRLSIAAATTYLSGVGSYVLHTGAGIRGGGRADREVGRPAGIADVPGIEGMLRGVKTVAKRLPRDLPNWDRFDAGKQNRTITIRGAAGLAAAYGARRADQFVVTVLGAGDKITLRAGRPVDVEVTDPLDGRRLGGGPIGAGAVLSVVVPDTALIAGRTASKPGKGW
jgi:hypothetical protein